MKRFLLVLGCLFPFSASASVLLANCDAQPYQIIVHNGGSERIAMLTRNGGEIEEFGTPTQMSFQIKSKGMEQPVVRPLSPDEEFCIWSGKIKVQRLNRGNANNGGTSLR